MEFDARLMSLMCHNVHSVWPHKAQMGGFPGAGVALGVTPGGRVLVENQQDIKGACDMLQLGDFIHPELGALPSASPLSQHFLAKTVGFKPSP